MSFSIHCTIHCVAVIPRTTFGFVLYSPCTGFWEKKFVPLRTNVNGFIVALQIMSFDEHNW